MFENVPPVVGIIGSRDFPATDMVVRFVRQLPRETIVVSGGARGVDEAAEAEAEALGLPLKIFRIEGFEWNLNKWIVADLRNELLVRYVERPRKRNIRNKIVAFWSIDKKTGLFTTGTGNALGHCQKLGVPFRVYAILPDSRMEIFGSDKKPSDELVDLILLREDIIRYKDIGAI